MAIQITPAGLVAETPPELMTASPAAILGSQDVTAPLPARNLAAETLDADFRARQAQALQAYQSRRVSFRDKLDAALLDPESFFKANPIDPLFADDEEKQRQTILSQAFLRYQNGLKPVPQDGFSRDLLRAGVSKREFGRIIEDDGELLKEAKAQAQGRKDTREVYATLGEAAKKSASAALAGKDKDDWKAVREEIQSMPGYKPGMDADFLEAYQEMRRASSAAMEPFADELREVWDSWEGATGAGKATGAAAGLIKDAFLGGQGETDAALGEKSTRRTAFEIYDKLRPEEREPFLQALGAMASMMPREQQPEFFANIAKQSGYSLETRAQDALTGARDIIENPDYWDASMATGKPSKFRRQSDFAAKVQNLREQSFDPVKKVSDSYLGKLAETVAYGTPDVLTTSLMASNPYTAAALFSSLKENHYQSLLQATEGEMGYEAASKFATRAAPAAAALETVSEHFGSKLLRGKLPFFDRTLTRAMDGITNPLARGATRFAAGGIESGLQEVGQNYIDPLVRGVSEAFGAETGAIVMPNAQENIEAFAAVFPLVLMGVPGAAGRDARVKEFAAASELQKRAAGYSAQSIQNIDAGIAKGLDSGAAAIDGEQRDPTTPEAIAAQKELQAQLEANKETADAATLSGVLPSFVKTADGWSVVDGETGEELGTAANANDALRVAAANSAAIDENNENQVAFLSTMLQAGEQTTGRDGGARQTGFEFSPGKKVTAAQEAAISETDEARVLEQAAAREAMGGDPRMSDVVLGKSVTDFKQRARNTVNQINAGGNILTVFHENTHGFFREALANNRLTIPGTIEAIRGIQAGFDDAKHHFLPATGEVTETQVDEAVSELVEALVLKNRKADGPTPGMVAKNLSSFARLHTGGKSLRSFVNAVREFFGVALSRAYQIRKGVSEGKIKESDIADLESRLFGLNQQDEHDSAAVEMRNEILGESAESLGPAKMADVLQQDAAKRITDPKAKMKVFKGISDRMGKLKDIIENTGNAYNFDAFGKQYEPEKRFSQEKKDILNGLAMMDGILASMPPDLRGRVGGYTQLAKLETPEKRLEYLRKKVKSVEKVVNGYLSKEYSRQLDKLFDRAKPAKGKPGEKPKGKVGADVHALFDVVSEARRWDQDKVDSHIAGLEAGINSGNLSPEQVAHNQLEAGLVGLVGNWKEADVSRRAAAVEEATRIFEKGYATHKLASLMKAEDRKVRRDNLAKDTGKTGDAGERDQKMLDDNGLKGGWKDNFLGLISFEQVAESLFGRDSKEAARIVDMERKAANLKEDMNQADMDALDDLFTKLGGSPLEGAKLSWDMSQKTMKVRDRTLSPLEAITATLMWRQEDGRRHMLGHKDENGNYSGKWHDDQKFVDEIESKLSDEAKAVRAHIATEYSKEWEKINPTFAELNGINLPKNPNYSPITVKPQQEAQGQMVDPVTGFAMSGASTTPGSLRTRGSSIAEPQYRDALQTFIAHKKQINHWLAYAPFEAEFGPILRNRDLGNSIEAKGGKQALSVMRGWMNFFVKGGFQDASAHLSLNEMMNRFTSRAAASVLIGRMGVLAIQTTQLGAALAEMPTGSFAARFGKLMTGQLGWGAAFRSEYIQRRLSQMPVVVQQAMEGLKASKPNQLKHQVRKIGSLISGADALMTAGTYAICYDYQLKQAKGMGLSGAEAEAYARDASERAVERVAQPTRAGTRSLYENTTTNPAARILWSFASDSRQKLALSLWRLGASDRSLGEKARAVAVTWVVGGMIATLIRAAMKDMRNDEDDEVFDERNWGVKRLGLSSLTGPFQGVPFLGDALEASIYGAAGEYLPEGNLLSSVPKSLKAATQVSEWGDKKPDEVMRDVETILSGLAPFNDNISAASSLSHLVRDLYGIGGNVTK